MASVNPNYHEVNVESAIADKNSIYYTYRKLISLRRMNDWVVHGEFELIETADEVFAYVRKFEGKKIFSRCEFI